MNRIYLNGKFVDEKRATVSALDRGFLYGDGLFETMRAEGGKVAYLREHVARFARSARVLRIPLGATRMKLERSVLKLLKLNCLKDAYVRITLTRGAHSGDLGLDTGAKPTLVIHARKFHGYPAALYNRGMKLAVADAVRPTRSAVGRHKTLNYLENLLARDAAKRRGFDETLLLDEQGFVAEGATSNIFFVRRGTLCTPSAKMNILPGITRGVVMKLARKAGIKVVEGRWKLKDLLRADAVFLTNSLMGVMPVAKIAGKRIGKKR